jgi:hypothetical protein
MVPGMRVYPLGNIELSVTFGDCCNFLTETLIFKVVDFEGSYHTILGRPWYTKFMEVPNYTSLKLKTPELNGVIMVRGSFEQAYASGRKHFELASTIANSVELQKLHQTVTEDASNTNGPTLSSTFHPTEDTKPIGVDPNGPTKTVWIGA